MMRSLDLSPAALGFISRTGPAMPAGVLRALLLPGEAELYGRGGSAAAGEAGASPGPWASMEARVPDEVVREFAGKGGRSVDEVLRAPGGGRELAFQLLAADAFLTWACEAAADAREPARMLREVLSALTVTTP